MRKVNRALVSEPFTAIRATLKQRIEHPKPNKELADELQRIGYETIEEAIASHRWTDRTFNLVDAYAFGVFYNGILVREGYSDPNSFKRGNHPKSRSVPKGGLGIYTFHEPDPATGMDGPETARRALHSMTPPTGKGYSLVIINPMWYATILERSTQYKVLSNVIDNAYSKASDLFARAGAKSSSTMFVYDTYSMKYSHSRK